MSVSEQVCLFYYHSLKVFHLTGYVKVFTVCFSSAFVISILDSGNVSNPVLYICCISWPANNVKLRCL